MQWNPTAIGLALDIVGFILIFFIGGFSFGGTALLWTNEPTILKPLRYIGASLIVAGFSFQLYDSLCN